MVDSITGWIGKIVNLGGTAPAQHVRCDHVKSFRQWTDAVLPGYFCRCAIFAAVKQDEFRTLASFEEVSFDVSDENGSMMVRHHKNDVQRLKFKVQRPGRSEGFSYAKRTL